MSYSDQEPSRSSSPLPWKEMFESAASSPLVPHAPPRLTSTMSSPALGYISKSTESNRRVRKDPNKTTHTIKEENGQYAPLRKVSFDNSSPNVSEIPNNVASKPAESVPDTRCEPNEEAKNATDSKQQSFQLAVHIAMAHAVLIFTVVVLYGIWRLLECYRKPIQWAILCSMPLRAVHGAIVSFWEASLRQGLLGTVLAVPFALCRALIVSTLDARLAFMHLIGKWRSKKGRTVKFTTLMEWLVSFAVMALAFEQVGQISLAVIPFTVITLYSFGVSLGLVPEIEELEADSSRPLLTGKPSQRWEHARSWLGWAFLPFKKVYKILGARISGALLNNLHHLVAVFLIILMIVGSLSGLVLFSYKIGLEGKGVVVALKTHVEQSNYVEKVGLKQWMEDNKVPELIDHYTGRAYDTISNQIDIFAAKYQMTELADVGKQYLIQIAHGQRMGNLTSHSTGLVASHPIVESLHNVMRKCREYDVKGIYSELQQAVYLILEHLNIPRDDLLDKLKQAGERWLGVGKHVFTNSSKFVSAVTRLLISTTSTVLSGAPEFISFCADSFVFFSVLHYLIASKSGGVMEQVLSMLPLSESTRTRCANVLDHAVSSVLLATVKAAFFQASFTWLLFRVLKIHFLYMSTLLAFFSALLPVIPTWWSSVPAIAQLALEGKYIQAIVLLIAHMGLMDYGVGAIQSGIPGHNAYLTGLSIAGGMALFNSAIEGAIMGPLLMTVTISLKNLYSEFVLTTAKGE